MSSFNDLKNYEFKSIDENSAKNIISKINCENIIKEALEMGNKTSFKKEKKKAIQIKDDLLLEEMRIKILKSYLDSARDKTIKEIRSELNSKIDEYIKDIRILLIKSNYEVDEYKKTSEKIEKENINIRQINTSLNQYNKELIKEIKNYQSNLDSLRKSYEILVKQKDLFEVILKEYAGNSPDQILSELKLAKEGSILLLDNYNDIMRENSEMKKEIENIGKKYEEKIENITREFNDYKEVKINEEKENLFKIKFLEDNLLNNEKYQKDNYNLHRILYYIYNLLFEEFRLNKDIKIDEKYLGVKESDFEPNIMYDEEIKNYIKLMIKTMHRESMDILFRECVGYLNMMIRKFFPNKKKFRFKPIEMLVEINNYIEDKNSKINEDNILIKQYKNNYLKLQKEKLKINKKLEKEKDFTNKNELQKSFNEGNDLHNKTNLTNPNIYNTPYTNKTYNNNINSIFSENNRTKNSLYNFKKSKLKLKINNNKSEENQIMNKNNLFEKRKAIKTLSLLRKDENEKNNILFINKKTRNRSNSTFKSKTMKRDENKNKIMIENGNQKQIQLYHDYNLFIEEANRLILYQPRMNSYNETEEKNGKQCKKEKNNSEEIKKNINNLLKNKNDNIYFQKNRNNQMEKKIYKEINYLIKNLKKY